MYKIIIAGSRDFLNYELLKSECNDHINSLTNLHDNSIAIISGNARGADRLGEKYAEEHNYKCHIMPADWNKHGMRAGYLRNSDMAKQANALIAFWDGKSKGTKNMIQEAKKANLDIKVIMYEDYL